MIAVTELVAPTVRLPNKEVITLAIRAGNIIGPWLSLVLGLLVTAGAITPAAMMIHGDLVLGISYYPWTWWAIPAVWMPAIAGVVALKRWLAPSALVVLVSAIAGSSLFAREYGYLTFGPAAPLAAYLYLRSAAEALEKGRSNYLLAPVPDRPPIHYIHRARRARRRNPRRQNSGPRQTPSDNQTKVFARGRCRAG